MRDLHFYPTLDQYRESVRSRFDPMFLNNRFYSNLIDLVIATRAPIFYRISDPSEHFAFSGAYHFETEREKYPNRFRRNLFWLHDFTHMLFPYDWDLFTVSEDMFIRRFTYQERIASTETEVFAYYRVPGLRDKVFQDEELYYDVLKERGYYGRIGNYPGISINGKPDASLFLAHRNKIVNSDEYGEAELGEYPEILAFFRKWRTLTPKWAGQRYKSMVGIRMPPTVSYVEYYTVNRYEAAIESYQWSGNQSHYEQVTLENVQRAYAMLGWSDAPKRWAHVPEALHSLEGAVFFQN